jgi:hypothetical protein
MQSDMTYASVARIRLTRAGSAQNLNRVGWQSGAISLI